MSSELFWLCHGTIYNTFFFRTHMARESIAGSVAEPEPPGAATFRVEPKPELIFYWAGAAFFRRLQLHLFGKQKRKTLT